MTAVVTMKVPCTALNYIIQWFITNILHSIYAINEAKAKSTKYLRFNQIPQVQNNNSNNNDNNITY